MNFFITNREKCKKAQKPEPFLCFFANAHPSNSQGTKVKDTSQGLWR